MCDTLCVLGDGVTLFAKNSDRPMSEPQTAGVFPRRGSGGTLPTQYIEIPDTGAFATVLSRPTWLWGAEHGINEHRVAIGNEMIFTRDDPRPVAPGLIGMDLVRLGLERARTAEAAVDVITTLLGRHGQGGVGDEIHGLSYWSSFLIADPTAAWVVETSDRTWAAQPVVGGTAISNRLTLRRDWTRASADVDPGTDVDSWRHPGLPTGFADTRLAAGRAFVAGATATGGSDCDPRAAVGALRDHGTGPWGVPGAAAAVLPVPAPGAVAPDGSGWTLCLHAGETAVTTASMVALVPAATDRPARAWLALGSPCVSVYVPVAVPTTVTGSGPGAGAGGGALAAALGDADVWSRFAALRDAVGSDGAALGTVRAELAPVEDALWDEADGLGTDPGVWEAFGIRASAAVSAALDRLAASGLGRVGRAAKVGR